MIAVVKSLRWTIFFSILLGIGLAQLTPQSWIDAMFPVVRMESKVMQKSPTDVLIALTGIKPWYTEYRNCKYTDISAYRQVGDLLHELNIDRTDRPANGTRHPAGRYDFGTWRIWPTGNTKLIAVYVQYDCDGRDVFVRVAEVAL